MDQKKQFMQYILLVLMGLVSTISVEAADYDFKAKNSDGVTIYYHLDGKTATVVSERHKRASIYSGDIRIPEKVVYNGKQYKVTKIRWWAFQNSNITSITLPNSIDTIEGSAFFNSKKLESIKLPKSLKYISGSAFSETKIKSLYIPASVTKIGSGSLGSGIEEVVVDKKNKVYDSRGNCNAIIETATNSLVSGCQTTIIPEGIESIKALAFWDLELKEVIIPNSVKRIENGAFEDNEKLSKVILPSSLKYIGKKAFFACRNLRFINFPESLDTIGAEAFWACDLEKIQIPSSVSHIGRGAFMSSRNLSKIVVNEDNKFYDSRNNCNAIIESLTNTLLLGCKNTVIPGTVNAIGDHALSDTGFNGNIPNSVIYIGNNAFHGSKIQHMSNSLFMIGDGAFGNCQMPEINISLRTRVIGKNAFRGISGVNTISVERGNNKYFGIKGANALFNNGGTLIKGCENTDFDIIANDWHWRYDSLVIGTSAFEGSFKAKETMNTEDSMKAALILPEGVIAIEDYAFAYCPGLLSVWIPSSVKTIGKYAFSGGKYNKAAMEGTIVSLIKEPFAIDKSVFRNSHFKTLSVPKGTKEKYEKTPGWDQFETITETNLDYSPLYLGN